MAREHLYKAKRKETAKEILQALYKVIDSNIHIDNYAVKSFARAIEEKYGVEVEW